MDKKRKKEWVINYLKRNNLEYILDARYKKGKNNWLKRYSDEIQSICSIATFIISVVIIGVVSILLTNRSNELLDKQIRLMEYEQKPIINISYENNIDGISILTVTNYGAAAQDYDIEIYSYFDVICNENQIGNIPIRIFLLEAVQKVDYLNSSIDDIAYIDVYNKSYGNVDSIKNDLFTIIREYTNLFWGFQLTYMIKVTATDRTGEIEDNYFIYNSNGIKMINEEYGIDIIDDFNSIVRTRGVLLFTDLNAETLFRYTLNIIREKKLYVKENFSSETFITYGQYEPK